jgi:hypothetical protein
MRDEEGKRNSDREKRERWLTSEKIERPRADTSQAGKRRKL